MRKRAQLQKIIDVAFFISIGLTILKFLPMQIWGDTILFDASFHIALESFAIYIIWFFIDQNHSWHLPFYICSALILFIISVQRIIANAHNDIGLLLGFTIALLSIALAEKENLKGKIRF